LASIQLIKKLLTNNNIKYLLIIGSYRDNEVGDAHPLQQTLQELGKAGVAMNRIFLSTLKVDDVRDLIVNFLKCSEERGASLAEIVFKKTNGNPFFVTEFLRTLYHDRIIEPDAALGWNWDMDRIARMNVTDNVVDLMADTIKTLPKEAQDILKTCACIGNRFDLETLSLLTDRSIDEVLALLNRAIQEGLIGMSGNQYIFHHDRIQEASYSLIPDADKPGMHYRIGRLILEKTAESELRNKLFYIVDQMNLGSALITDRREREELAAMNLDCGRKAKASIAYATASGYLSTGIKLLEEDCWDTQYELTHALYTELIEVASLAGDFAKMNSLTEIAIAKARTLLDKANIYKAKISACIAQEDIGGALTAGMVFTGLTGHKNTGTKKEILNRYLKFRIAYFGKSDKHILNLPEMTDPLRIAANEVGAQLAYALYNVAPNVLVSGIFSNVVEATKYGLSSQIGSNLCGLGLILISGFNDIKRGYRFGNLGMELGERPLCKKSKSRIIYVFNTQIRHWKEHLRNTIEPYTEGYQLGIESGDLLYAADNLGMQNSHNFMLGKNLIELEQEIENHTRIIKGLNQMQIYSKNSILLQLVQNLRGKSEDPIILVGSAFDETKSIPLWTATNNRLLLATYYVTRIFLSMIFHNYTNIIRDLDIQSKYVESIAGSYPFREYAFFDSIGRLAVYPTASPKEKKLYLKKVRANLKKIKKWAKFAPMNNLHLYYLVRAELARVLGDNSLAEKSYDLAIESSREHEYLYNEMYYNELAARYYLSIGNKKLARSYLIDAYECCSRWGASAKLRHMQDMYGELLPSSALYHIASSDDSTTMTTGSSTQIMDIATVVKASQTISGEVALGRLLARMMKIAMENAGAQRGFMILEENDRLMVEAESTIEDEEVRVLESIPVDTCGRLSAAMVHYVARTKEILILNNAPVEGNFTKDPYVVRYSPKSILCAPIINQGRLTGVLYLENNLSTRAFTQERLDVLNILSSQIAISIDNAKLYEHLEEKVKQRTEELRAATEALWGEMELAKKIQTVLLPDNPAIKGCRITGYMKPADMVGGDYYDVINTGSGDWVIIGDVSGHGVPAGLVMMMVQTSIQALVREFPDIDPSKLLTIVNKAVKYNVGKMEEDKYMTISAFRFRNDGSVSYSGLHQEPLLYRSASEEVEILPTEGIWLSPWEMGTPDSTQEFTLNQGDTLLLYTDGITEAKNQEGTFFTEEKLAEILKKYGKLKTYEIKDKILEALRPYTLEDDVTMVVIKKQ
jgi:predicted ATPase/serine phosphatase RsbU (regulator of sigma subunit)